MRAELGLLVESERLSLTALAEVVAAHDRDAAEPTLERALRTLSTLPSGLVGAESLWLTRTVPVGAVPLDPDRRWFVIDRAIVHVLPPRRAALLEVARRLGELALLGRWLHHRRQAQPEWIALLEPGRPWDPERRAGLALLLGAHDHQLAALERDLPSVRADLSRLSQGVPPLEVFVHPSVQPSRGRRVGASLAERLLEALPAGPVRLLLADDALCADSLSPYLREAGPELLSALAQEPTGPEGGPARALRVLLHRREARHATPELAALAFQALRAAHPALVEERLAAERASGLLVGEEADIMFGVGDGAALIRELDPRGALARERAPLAFVAGPSDTALVAAAEVLLETGRVELLGLSFGSRQLSEAAVALPELLIASDDAFSFAIGERLPKRAEALVRGSGVQRLSRALVDERTGAPEVLVDVLRRARRAQAMTQLLSSTLILYAAAPIPLRSTLEEALAPGWAGRLALSQIALSDAPRPPNDPDKGPKTLRFRA